MSVKEAFASVPAFKDTRIASLYSDFSHLKVYNPEGYEANCKAWKDLITQCIRSHAFKSSVSIRGALASAFSSPKLGEPKALHIIVDQMVKDRVLVPWSLFQSSSFSARTSLTDYLFPSTLVSRSWTSLKLSLYTSKSAGHEEYFIDLALLAEKAEELLSKLQKQVSLAGVYSGKLFNEETLINKFQELDSNISTIDAKALIIFLTRDSRKIQILKKESPEIETYLKLDDTPITENDIGVVNLKAAIERVGLQATALEEKVDSEIPSRIKTLLSSTNGKSETTRSRIKNLLLQKARANKSLEQSSNLLTKLTDILDEIDKAKTNADMVSTLQSAKNALTAFNEQSSVNEVDEIMLDIDEQISKTNEISDSLGMAQDNDVDTSEIDRELEELEAEELLKKQSTSPAQVPSEEEEVLERLRNISLKETPSLDSSEAAGAKTEEKPQKIANTT